MKCHMKEKDDTKIHHSYQKEKRSKRTEMRSEIRYEEQTNGIMIKLGQNSK